MKIAIDARALATPFGGIARYTQEMIGALSRVDSRNQYVFHIAHGGHDRLPAIGPNMRWEISRSRARSLGWDLGRGVGGAQLFHGLNYSTPLLARAPTVVTVHDLTVKLFPEMHPFSRRLRHRLLPHLCRRAARVIADSDCTKRDLVRHYGISKDKIDVVYLAASRRFQRVSCPKVLAATRARHGLPNRFALYLGAVEPRKQLPLLIRAIRRIRRENQEFALVVAGTGEGSYVRTLEQLAVSEGLRVGRDLIFIDAPGDAEVSVLYSLCAMFVYPSRYEGFGLPPLEAMACGAPVVVPGHSSLGEIYAGASLQFDLAREETLAAAIQRLLVSKDLRGRLITKGRRLAVSRSWDDVASETIEVYRRAVAQQPEWRSAPVDASLGAIEDAAGTR